MTPILQCKVLGKRYGAKEALSSVDLQLGRGRIVGLLGPNGSGKTTMIKLASGILTPVSYTHLDVYKRQPEIGSSPPSLTWSRTSGWRTSPRCGTRATSF